MKVLSHEDDVLKNGYGDGTGGHQARVLPICVDLVEDLLRSSSAGTRGNATRQYADCRDVAVRHHELALYLAQSPSPIPMPKPWPGRSAISFCKGTRGLPSRADAGQRSLADADKAARRWTSKNQQECR